MSDLNLVATGQHEVNAKNPNVNVNPANVYFNLKSAKELINLTGSYAIGYRANDVGIDFGRVSERVTAGVGGLTEFIILADDTIVMKLGGNKWGGFDVIDVDVEGTPFQLTWNSSNLFYEGTVVGSSDYMETMVGGTCKVTLSEGTP